MQLCMQGLFFTTRLIAQKIWDYRAKVCSVLFLFSRILLSHVDCQHEGEPINNLNKGDNTEPQVEPKDAAKTCHKVGQSQPLGSLVLW